MALILPSSAVHLCVLPNIFLREYVARSQPDFSAIFSSGDASAVISVVRTTVPVPSPSSTPIYRTNTGIFGEKPWMWGSRAPTYIFGGLEGYHYIRRWPVTFRCSIHTQCFDTVNNRLSGLSVTGTRHTHAYFFPSMFGDVSELWLVVAGWRTGDLVHFINN